MLDYSFMMLDELNRLENLSTEYREELRFLSKKIRKDFWNSRNEKKLAQLLYCINNTYERIFKYLTYFDLSCILEYVSLLKQYSVICCPELTNEYFEQLLDDIQLENARVIIERKWKDVTIAEDGTKSFKEIFAELYLKCINGNKNKFFHELKPTDVLCRVVNDKYSINRERFIPWDNASTLNRWNPPGKTYLYLSFTENDIAYNSDLKLSEYICLEEYRAEKGKKYFFCNFKPVKKGMILDLSYNDVPLRRIKRILGDYEESIASKMVKELMSNPNAIEKYKDKKKLKEDIIRLQSKYRIDEDIIEESLAKQYLKMICSCIYKKVDESDDDKKEMAYKSFWALAQYLESQGVTGIIYPCTRTNKVCGKNLVLFNKFDAEPIESTIREFIYLK